MSRRSPGFYWVRLVTAGPPYDWQIAQLTDDETWLLPGNEVDFKASQFATIGQRILGIDISMNRSDYLETLNEAKPFIRSVLTFLICARMGDFREPAIETYYRLADSFIAQLEKDLSA